ncbi:MULTISPECIES: histidinol dehydrogenase [unclassified Oceanispirochaeta]|uniref:histidinol dehydrogenase n=1 Tax=unclassified Oceanispirochaeta TaxID=2635722 RepID=UPI000E08EA8B|nr:MULTISPECIES: histidinol dehydrogenase [unclassified Oceanispirochaeta]MBF9018384.1 histidinol dehydrogenase [Oceanispirochaeta sp. M2]NPD75202.1 histidinol dehydrogenase [Oceanispirochaeta sp. M1]RDG28952.1 histidinol dehydrogenase [Oceanispirochaeta sp. M1]
MKINRYVWKTMSPLDREKLYSRSEINIKDVSESVEKIIRDVREKGDAALLDYNHRFDGTPVNMNLRVSKEEFDRAATLISDDVKDALEYSIDNVRRFHLTQKPEAMSMIEIQPGLLAGEKAIPLDSAGLYVPRGRGNFPSMLYMLAVPAVVAGVKRVCVVTPPDKEGNVDPACLYAARLCGVEEVYKVGGAQAIAALAYGTESIARVHKLSGPGSMYVAAAKRLLFGQVDVGLPAGPSESIVIADGSADPRKVALDLMIEAEHGSDSAALLITDSKVCADACEKEIRSLTKALPEPRKTFVEDVMKGYGGIILTDSVEDSAEVANLFATEHLQIQTAEPFQILNMIRHAGEILLGDNTPFSIANYAVGPNAVLPTGGNARTWSAVSVRDFIKYSSVIYSDETALKEISSRVECLADYEGFTTHGDALRKRR